MDRLHLLHIVLASCLFVACGPAPNESVTTGLASSTRALFKAPCAADDPVCAESTYYPYAMRLQADTFTHTIPSDPKQLGSVVVTASLAATDNPVCKIEKPWITAPLTEMAWEGTFRVPPHFVHDGKVHTNVLLHPDNTMNVVQSPAPWLFALTDGTVVKTTQRFRCLQPGLGQVEYQFRTVVGLTPVTPTLNNHCGWDVCFPYLDTTCPEARLKVIVQCVDAAAEEETEIELPSKVSSAPLLPAKGSKQ